MKVHVILTNRITGTYSTLFFDEGSIDQSDYNYFSI